MVYLTQLTNGDKMMHNGIDDIVEFADYLYNLNDELGTEVSLNGVINPSDLISDLVDLAESEDQDIIYALLSREMDIDEISEHSGVEISDIKTVYESWADKVIMRDRGNR